MSIYKHNRNNLANLTYVSQGLDYSHKNYIQKCRKSFPYLPEQWLADQENYHKWLVQLQPKDLIVKVGSPTLRALDLLLDTNVGSTYEDIQKVSERVFSNAKDECNLKPWKFDELFSDVQQIDRGESIAVQTYSLIMTVCGLLSIYWPSILRGFIFQVRHNTQNAFNVGYSDYLMEDANESKSLKDVINTSYNDLIQETINVRPKLLNVDRKEIESCTGQAVAEAFKPFPDPLDGFVASAMGEISITYIPYTGSNSYLDYHFQDIDSESKDIAATENDKDNTWTKHENGIYFTKSLDAPLNSDSETTFMEELEDTNTVNPEIGAIEKEKRKKDDERLNLVKRYINDPAILTDKQRQVLNKRYLQGEKVNPYDKIGEEMGGIRKQTTEEHHDAAIIKLKKLPYPDTV